MRQKQNFRRGAGNPFCEPILNSSEGMGGHRKNPFCRGMDIFWNYTMEDVRALRRIGFGPCLNISENMLTENMPTTQYAENDMKYLDRRYELSRRSEESSLSSNKRRSSSRLLKK